MTLLVMIIPAAILVALVCIALVVVGLFIKKENRHFTGTDVVLGGVQFLALAATALAVVSVLFAAVDYMIPDVLVDAAYRDNESIRSALAVMFVTMPITAFVLWKAARTPSWMQRFVAAGVLVLAGGALVGVVIALVYNFLAGELGMRLLAKLVTLAVISGGIGWYYALFMHEGRAVSKRATTIFLVLTGLLVVKALVWGFIMTGGPFAARAERFDERRLSDVSGIQSQVQMYWQQNHRLPNTAAELSDPLTGYALPTDPETGEAYVYRRVSETTEPNPVDTSLARRVGTFEICATFVTERRAGKTMTGGIVPMRTVYPFDDMSMPSYYSGDTSPFWDHGIGEHCFVRTVKEAIDGSGKPI